jgi:peptide/nickel transport system permease protein
VTSVTTAPPRGAPAPIRALRVPGRRLGLWASYATTAFVLVTLNFLLPRLLPGGPFSALSDPSAPTYVNDAATRAALSRYYGLDRPLLAQYGHYLAALVRGDLGRSIRYGVPVSSLLAARLPWTLLLVGTAMLLAAAVAIPAGVHSGWRRGRGVDRGLLALFLGMRNLPAYFLGSLALYVFSVQLHWFPISGASTPFAGGSPLAHVLDVARHLVLPASVLAVEFAGGDYLLMRAGMVGELGAGYLLLGRAKGLSERRLKYRYAARNAILPVVTLTGMQLGFAVTGTIFVETVFAYPGLGRLMYDAVAYRDYPVLQGCFLVLTFAVLLGNLAVDLLAARLDPRVRR